MPIRLRLAVAFAVIAAAVFALGSWLFVAGLASAQLSAIDSQLSPSSHSPGTTSRRAAGLVRPSLRRAARRPVSTSSATAPCQLCHGLGRCGLHGATCAYGRNRRLTAGVAGGPADGARTVKKSRVQPARY